VTAASAWTVTEEFLEDYAALCDGVGALRKDRDAIRVSGADALDYLQGQCSQDLSELSEGSSVDSLILEPQGKLVALVRVTRTGGEEVLLDVDAGYGPGVLERLRRFKLRVKAELEPLDWRCIALRGAKVGSRAGSRGTAIALPYAWGREVGVDVFGDDPRIPEDARECSADALESLRVESGIPVMGLELNERTIAAEAGLLERCVSLTKGCYTGQELIARLDARGNKVARRLRGLVAADGTDPAYLLGAQVLKGEKSVGAMTSAAWSPQLHAAVALGYLHRDVVVPSQLELRFSSTSGEDAGAGQGEAVPVEARELPLVS
jgi:folate-binding protein YgfZ